MSEKNNVEQELCSSAEKKNDSEMRSKLKGKRVMIHESPRNDSEMRRKLKVKGVMIHESPRKPIKSASKIRTITEERREVQKKENALKFEEIFKRKPRVINPKKVVK